MTPHRNKWDPKTAEVKKVEWLCQSSAGQIPRWEVGLLSTELCYQANGHSRDGKDIQEGKFYGFKLREGFSFWSVLREAYYLLKLCEGALWPKHKTQRGSLAEAGRASRRAMNVGSCSVQGRALGDAPSPECPYHLVF